MRFDMIRRVISIEHRLIKPNHLWTNGQVVRMNRTIKDAAAKSGHQNPIDSLTTLQMPGPEHWAALRKPQQLKSVFGYLNEMTKVMLLA